jgi:hypothetical protein
MLTEIGSEISDNKVIAACFNEALKAKDDALCDIWLEIAADVEKVARANHGRGPNHDIPISKAAKRL